jgi:hypothetical protein
MDELSDIKDLVSRTLDKKNVLSKLRVKYFCERYYHKILTSQFPFDSRLSSGRMSL